MGPGYRGNVITNEAVEQYMMGLLPARDAVLSEIEEQARRRDIPIVGPAVARVLYQLARMVQARTVFELGSAVGYSTIWWARAVAEGGRVVYTDGDRKNADEARGYFARAGVTDRVDVRVGDALEILSEEKPASYDVIFCDIDKEDYPRALKVAMPRVRKGGLLVADNVLRNGTVVLPPEQQDAETRGIVEFNRLLYGSEEFFTTILPIRDGVAVALKI
jgi:predicted O-methyltransferase YrrM